MQRPINGPIYRPMLWRALSTAWAHKELWPFALLAGLMGSGVIVNDLLQQAQIALTPNLGVGAFLGGDIGVFFERYASLILSSGTKSIVLTVIGTIAILASGVFLIVLCQQVLLTAIRRAIQKKTKLTGRDLLRSLHHHHYLRILGSNAIFHVLIYIVLGGGGVLMRNVSMTYSYGDSLAVIIAAITLFLAFVLNILSMLTLIAVGQERATLFTGFLEALDRFLRHPLVACETALLVFATNFFLSIGYLLGLCLLAFPIGLLFSEALNTGTLFGVMAIAFFGTLTVTIFTIFTAGFMTTFTYSMWTLLAHTLDSSPFKSRFHHHIRQRLHR